MEKDIRKKIKQHLKDRQSTVYRLAKNAGIQPSSIYRFLDGKTITIQTLDKIEEAMKNEMPRQH